MSSSGWVFAETSDFFAEYEIREKLGGGAYGKVYKCMHKESGDIRAVKCIQKQHFQNEFDLFRHEVSIMREIDHPNVIKFYGFYETYKLLYIVMEYCAGGELFRFIRKKFAPRGFIHRNAPCLLRLFGLVKPKVYSEKEVAHWMRQTLQGLEYLHSKRIVHADIKPQNLMLKFDAEEEATKNKEGGKKKGKSALEESPIKIIDFGLASVVKKKHLVRGQDGTPEYMSPECIKGKYTIHSDMWSMGVLMFTMLFGFSPFWTESVYETYQLITKHGFQPDAPTGSHGNSFPSFMKVSDDAKDLITRLLRKDPVDRLSATEALAHPWFSTATETAIENPTGPSVVQNLHQQTQRTKLHKLVLEMLIESITDEDLEAWKSDFALVSRSKGGVVDFNGIKDTLAMLREKGSNSGLFSPVALMSPTVMSPRANDPDAGARLRRGFPSSPMAGFAPLSPSARGASGIVSEPKISAKSAKSEKGKGKDRNHNEEEEVDRSAISLRELLIQTVEMKLLAKEERVWSAFDAIDEDGSGMINATELAKALRIPHAAAEKIIRECDEDGDGFLDLDEFVEQFIPTSEDEKKKEKDRKLARERQIARIRKQRAAAEAARKLLAQQPSTQKNSARTSSNATSLGLRVDNGANSTAPTVPSSSTQAHEEEYYSPVAPPAHERVPSLSVAPATQPVIASAPLFAKSDVLGGLSLSLCAEPVKHVRPTTDDSAIPVGLILPLSEAAAHTEEEMNPLEMEERRADLWDMGIFLPVAKKLHSTISHPQESAGLPELPKPTVEKSASSADGADTEVETEVEGDEDSEELDPVKIALKRGQKIHHRPVPESVREKQNILRSKIQQQTALLAETFDQDLEVGQGLAAQGNISTIMEDN